MCNGGGWVRGGICPAASAVGNATKNYNFNSVTLTLVKFLIVGLYR